MVRYRLGCELEYSVRERTTFIFNVGVSAGAGDRVAEERYTVEPRVVFEEFTTLPESNRYLRLTAEPCELRFAYEAVVEKSAPVLTDELILEVPVNLLPAEAIPYLYPSRYCQSDKLARFARREFGGVAPGYARVAAVANWIYDHVEYLRGSSDQHTSAYDTATERAGVCRDFAHLGIAFCRALGVPARFVTAYSYKLEPADFHACFEAYLGGRWYVFDATRLAPPAGFVPIAVGRDAADTSFNTFYGLAEMTRMRVFIDPDESAGLQTEQLPEFTTSAIALS
jgi:transglutaminase-like putative cysteine protease